MNAFTVMLLGLHLLGCGSDPVRPRPPAWVPQTSGTPVTLLGTYFTDARAGTVVGAIGTILRTTDSGTTWTVQNSGTDAHLLDVAFMDTRRGVAVGGRNNILTIVRTTDGGQTWTPQLTLQTSNDYYLRSVCFPDSSTGTVVGDLGTILRTTDSGTTWTVQNSGTSEHLLGVFFTDISIGTAVGLKGTILRTTDGGETWVPQTSGTPAWLFDVFFTDSNHGVAVGQIGSILSTSDGGENWLVRQYSVYDLRSVCFANANVGSAVGGGSILRTTDGGQTWVQQEGQGGGAFGHYDVHLVDVNYGTIVGDGGVILHTTTGGNVAP